MDGWAAILKRRAAARGYRLADYDSFNVEYPDTPTPGHDRDPRCPLSYGSRAQLGGSTIYDNYPRVQPSHIFLHEVWVGGWGVGPGGGGKRWFVWCVWGGVGRGGEARVRARPGGHPPLPSWKPVQRHGRAFVLCLQELPASTGSASAPPSCTVPCPTVPLARNPLHCSSCIRWGSTTPTAGSRPTCRLQRARTSEGPRPRRKRSLA